MATSNPPEQNQSLYGANMADDFGIGHSTYGRSATGMFALKSYFNEEIDRMIKVLNGDKYAKFNKVIKANWVGDEADTFLGNVEKTRSDLLKELYALKDQFNTAIDSDRKMFEQFHQKNIRS